MVADPVNKHRLKIFEGMLKNYYHWRAYVEQDGLYSITIEGEMFSFFDLLDGIDTLPLRQRQALWLICIEGLKERSGRADGDDRVVYPGSDVEERGRKETCSLP